MRNLIILSSVVTVVGCSSSKPDASGGATSSAQGGSDSRLSGGTSNALGGADASPQGGANAAGANSTNGGTSALGGGANANGGANTAGAPGAGTAGTSTAGTSNGGAHTNPLSQDLIDAFVAAHNQARSGPLNPPASPALPPVAWDATLADVAYNYLSKCQGTTLVNHNANRTSDYAALGGSDYVGENIYATTASTVQPSQALQSWMSEASSFDYANPDFSAAGHYTQVVWRASVRIGCAIVNCPGIHYPNSVLCDYAPGGNISGQKPY